MREVFGIEERYLQLRRSGIIEVFGTKERVGGICD